MNTSTLISRCELHASTICEALFNVMDCWLNPNLFDAQLDLAIRNWARVHKPLKLILDNADKSRIEALKAMFARHGFTTEQSEVRALTVMLTQIGYISMHINEPRSERLGRVKHYVELFASDKPTKAEIDIFLDRH